MTGSRHPASPCEADTARPSDDKAPSLPPPRVLQLLPDIPDGQPNLLPMSATREALRVEFEMWKNSEPSPEFPETLTLYWDGTWVDSITWDSQVLPEELYILVPVERMGDGQHTLNYHVVLGDGNDATSHDLIVTVDKVPPTLPGMSFITFPPEVISAGVTDRYLKANGDELKGTTTAYEGGNAGDLLIWYWNELPGGNNEVGRKTLSKAEAGQAQQISIPGAAIRLAKDGTRFAYFSIQARALTPAQKGNDYPLTAKATPAPRILPPPTVKEADGGSSGSTLRPIQAISGATLLVTESEETIEPGETIKVYWGTPGSRGAFSPTPTAPGKRTYHIPAHRVAEQSGYTLTLYYEVLQRDGEWAPSDPHTLKVEAVSNMPTPSCDQVNGGQLSIKRLADGTAKVSAQAWPFVTIGQEVKLELYGLQRGSGRNLRRPIGTTTVTSNSGEVQIGTFTKADLEYFTLNQPLEILAYATFDDSLTWQAFAALIPLLVE